MLTLASRIYGSHLWFMREGDAIASPLGATASRARTSNVGTVVFAAAHGLWVGSTVTLAGLGGTGYNGSVTVLSTPTTTSITFASAGGDEATTADTGGSGTLAGTASRTFRPGANDPELIDVGVCEECSDSREVGNEIEIWTPSPGKLVLNDVIENKHKLMLKFTAQEWGPFSHEVLYLTEALDSSSTQFNPLEGGTKKGWLKVQRYDQDNNLRLVMDLYGKIKISGDVQFGGSDIIKPQFEFLVLHSTLNTGTL